MFKESKNLALALDQIKGQETAAAYTDGRKDNSTVGMTVISAFGKKGVKSGILNFVKFFRTEKAVG